jgi:hypothetical protein
MPRGFEPGPALRSLDLHTGLSPDELGALLPPGARQRLATLTIRRDDHHRLIPEGDSVRALNAERFRQERALQKLQAPAGDGGNALPDDDLRIVVAKRQLAAITEEASATAARYQVRAQAFQAVAQVHTAVMAWLANGKPANTVCEDFEGPEPKLNKGEDLVAAIERLRRRVRELRADLHRIESAPFPSTHAKARAKAQSEELAQAGAPTVSLLIEHDQPLQWAQRSLSARVHNTETPAIAFSETDHALAFTLWLHKSAAIAAIEREIDAEADDKAAMTHQQREVAEAQVMADLLSVERDEAFLLFVGWADGLSILPRADISPAALLGVTLVTQPAREPGSSPERQSYETLGPARARRL